MLRTFILALSTLSLLVATPVLAQVYRAAAVVNDNAISTLDVEQRTKLAILSAGGKDTPEARNDMRPAVLRQLIDERLQMQEAKRQNITISKEAIDEGVETIAQRNKLTVDQLEAQLKAADVALQTLRNQVEASLAWQEVLLQTVVPTIEVSQEEIDAEVQRVISSGGSDQVRLVEIFIPRDAAGDEERSRALVQHIVSELQGGASFQQLASEFSQAPTAATGGDRGWVLQDQLPPELQTAVRQMQPGQLAGPLSTPTGFYIIGLVDRAKVAGGGTGRIRLSQILFDVPPGTRASDVVDTAREQTADIKSCAQADRLATSIGSPGSGPMGDVNLTDLPADLRARLAGQPVGVPTAPLERGDVVAVLVVCAREGGGDGIDRERIAQQLRRERIELRGQRLLRDLRRNANIDIRM